MVIANWVERQLEDRRTKREQMLIEQGREEGFELGRAYERERIANGDTDDNDPPHPENGR